MCECYVLCLGENTRRSSDERGHEWQVLWAVAEADAVNQYVRVKLRRL